MEDNSSLKNVSYDNFSGIPTIVSGILEEDSIVKISMMGDSIIIDKKFIDEITSIVNNSEIPKDFMSLLGLVQSIINNYFYSSNGYDKSRTYFYSRNEFCETDEEGMIIGTKISHTKGKNIAACAEKAVTAYIILDKLHREGKITKKPSLVLSSLSTENLQPRPHAFIIIDGKGEYPANHFLYDPENPTLIENNIGKRSYTLGVYCLTDEQRENIVSGVECTPESLYSAYNFPCQIISDKLTYGAIKRPKTK